MCMILNNKADLKALNSVNTVSHKNTVECRSVKALATQQEVTKPGSEWVESLSICMGLFCAIFSLGSRFVCWGDGVVLRMRDYKYLPLG